MCIRDRNAFGFYYQVIVFYIKHFDDAGGPDIAFGTQEGSHAVFTHVRSYGD